MNAAANSYGIAPIPQASVGARRVSLALSVVLHAIVLLSLARTTVRLITPSQAIHVTILQAAPPPPPAAAGAAAAEAAPEAAPAVIAEPVPKIDETKPQTVRPAAVHRRRSRPTSKVREKVAPSESPASAASVAQEPGIVGGVIGGSEGGKLGGIVGGRGDEVFPADQVAVPPALLSGPKPEYPAIARQRGIEGLVVIDATIGRDGTIERDRLRVVESVATLDDAALKAVRSWLFRPGRDSSGQPVRVEMRVPIRFQLR